MRADRLELLADLLDRTGFAAGCNNGAETVVISLIDIFVDPVAIDECTLSLLALDVFLRLHFAQRTTDSDPAGLIRLHQLLFRRKALIRREFIAIDFLNQILFDHAVLWHICVCRVLHLFAPHKFIMITALRLLT